MRCERVAPYLTAYAAGELPRHTHAWVESHASSCAACSSAIARHGAIGVALRMLPDDAAEPPDWLAAAVGARVRERESHARRRLLPIPPVPPDQLARMPGAIARVVQENRDAIVSGAATAAVAAGAAWLAWRAVRSLRRPTTA